MSRRAAVGAIAALATLPTAGRVRPAQATTAPLRVLAWRLYLPKDVLASFTEMTGIPVDVTFVDSNEAFVEKLEAGDDAAPFDLCMPSSVRALDWLSKDLLQPWILSRIEGHSNINPLMLRYARDEWRLDGSGPHWLPYTWGAEAIGWRTDAHLLHGDQPSFGDVWEPPATTSDAKGNGIEIPRVMVSAHSGIVGAGLYLERIGKLPAGAMWRTYQAKNIMQPVFEQVTEWCIERKQSLRMTFWNDEDSQREGFVNDEVSIGQTWDKPTLELLEQGLPLAFQAPREGALVWQSGFSLAAAAKNVESAHALMSYLSNPQVAGRAIDTHGFHSAVIGAEAHANAKYRQQFAAAFPGNAIHELNLWPPEPKWYLDQRLEYRNRLMAAFPKA